MEARAFYGKVCICAHIFCGATEMGFLLFLWACLATGRWDPNGESVFGNSPAFGHSLMIFMEEHLKVSDNVFEEFYSAILPNALPVKLLTDDMSWANTLYAFLRWFICIIST